LIPSFWATPLTFFGRVDAHTMMVLFGCRPAGMPLVPGDEVPAGLVNGLKALADPTRLRILRYLAASPLTPADLSRKLRLRAPTVVHHLAQLRLAGMVAIEIEPDGERRYVLRLAGIDVVRAQIDTFIHEPTERNI
jgi:DNA-binding transcriptional ArsR family regulator